MSMFTFFLLCAAVLGVDVVAFHLAKWPQRERLRYWLPLAGF